MSAAYLHVDGDSDSHNQLAYTTYVGAAGFLEKRVETYNQSIDSVIVHTHPDLQHAPCWSKSLRADMNVWNTPHAAAP